MLSKTLFADELPATEELLAIADRLNLDISQQPDRQTSEEAALFLKWNSGILSLNLGETGICVEFQRHFQKLKVTQGFSKKSLLAKAIGLAPGQAPVVMDATAGLGRDALLLAGLGCRVIACEQNAVLFELILNGLNRPNLSAEVKAILGQISWQSVDSIGFLSNHKYETKPDVIYMDPMYPEKKKSALPKKEMQILQNLLGPDLNSQALLSESLKHAAKRVVVKRPISAPPLMDKPSHSFTGKTVRYDMYVVTSTMENS